MQANLHSNLEQLGVTSVDLTLIHFPCSTRSGGDGAGTWRAMEDFYNSGKSKAIGVSNYGILDLEAIKRTGSISPAVNQCKFSVVFQDQATIDYCKTANITYQVRTLCCLFYRIGLLGSQLAATIVTVCWFCRRTPHSVADSTVLRAPPAAEITS